MTQTANDRDRATSGNSTPAGPRHPLAPLTVDETATACRLALAGSGPATVVAYCELVEPPKEVVLGWDSRTAGPSVPRRARCVLYHPSDGTTPGATTVVTVSLDDEAVVVRTPVPGVQPPIMLAEYLANGEQVKTDPGAAHSDTCGICSAHSRWARVRPTSTSRS